jgi:hypothetical protein
MNNKRLTWLNIALQKGLYRNEKDIWQAEADYLNKILSKKNKPSTRTKVPSTVNTES